MENLLVLGTGESLKVYKDILKEKIKSDNIKVMAYSNSIEFCINELEILPDYWFFIDPTSTTALRYLNKNYSEDNKANLTILLPECMGSYESMWKYWGSSGINDLNSYNSWITVLDSVKPKVKKFQKVPTTTIKHINLYKNSEDSIDYQNLDLDNDDAEYRFKYDRIVCGSGKVPPEAEESFSDNMAWLNIQEYINDNVVGGRRQYGMQNMAESKLTSVVLPMCSYLSVKNLYLLGFDGIGSRWDEPNNYHGIWDCAQFDRYYLPKWLEWKKYHNMNILSVVEDKHTQLNKFIPYTQLEEIF
jgi:hypothetical protein|tara:strand:+ start:1300 stop:2205 length:906 start_codon:yes stop_codon:yes gene_type:complete